MDQRALSAQELRAMRRDAARFHLLRRGGYSYDRLRGVIKSMFAQRREPEHREDRPSTRPRERRARNRSAPSRGSPDDPHQLEVIPLARFRRELERAPGGAA